MLFRKKIEPSCSYCHFGVKLENENVLCSKRGIMHITAKCRKFRYDPCKRIPPKVKALDFSKYEDEDYSL